MDRYSILRSINLDLIEYIQKKVRVKFDYRSRVPLCFYFKDKCYWIHEIVLAVKTYKELPINGFIVRSNKEIFFLYFHFFNFNKKKVFNEGNWVLSYKILNNDETMYFYREERNMLVNMTLKRIADFHGHVCPELIIGAKFCEYVMQLINQKGSKNSNIFIIAENSTSAIDAIQILLGTTLGNQRLKIIDKGKHNYLVYFLNEMVSLKFAFKYSSFIDGIDFISIEKKILENNATIDDVIQYQDLIDNKITTLMNLSPSDVFNVEKIQWKEPEYEISGSYFMCSSCKEIVLRSKLIYYKGKFYCSTCFNKIKCRAEYLNIQ